MPLTSRTPAGVPEFSVPSTYHRLAVHVVFATQDRVPFLVEDWRNDLHAYIGGILRELGAPALAVGGVADHVHFIAGLRTTHCVADLVREVKKGSHSWLLERTNRFGWQVGYGAFSVSPSDEEAKIQYVLNQEEHHRHLSSADELRALLEEAGIEIDERYFD